ncbi:MAG: hypothetical protein A2017_06615 [Lentisphaerae bacterium GWF2_44_16]|nr:MAG: hypothetical protein A2017_06615 [Lentisphaerae bacterium GWF2_44_16]
MKKKIVMGLVSIVLTVMLSGCYSTSTISEFDPVSGNLIKQTETSQPIIDQITASTKDKTVFYWESGWIAAIHVQPSAETMFTAEMIATKRDKGLLTVHKDQQNMDKIEGVIKAAKSTESLSVTTSGIGSGTAATSTNSAASETK